MISKADIPEWCIKVVVEKSDYRFKELIGTFIIIIDQSKVHRLTFVSDVLGLRPMFLGRNMVVSFLAVKSGLFITQA